ncbi:MAG: M13 family metallopeptidase [Thermoanaerobaculia bacterium]
MHNATRILVPLLLAALPQMAGASGGSTSTGGAPPAAPAAPAPAANIRLTPQAIETSVLGAMDRTADPCQDFYRYACGSWIDEQKMPGDQVRWIRSFSVVGEANRAILNEILTTAAADPGGDADKGRIGDYFATCMDEAAIDAAALAPLKPLLAEAAAVRDPESLIAAAAHLQAQGIDALWTPVVSADPKDPGTYIFNLSQGGFGMPDRDYYVSSDPDKRALMSAYRDHVARMFRLLGVASDRDARETAGRVVEFETELARLSLPSEALRDPNAVYHRVERGALERRVSKIDWKLYFAELGYPDIARINLATPEFFTGLGKLVAATQPATLRQYLRWRVIDASASRLGKDVVQANFDFYQARMSGRKEMAPRWKRCVDATQGALGEAIGKVYVGERFSPESKEMALEMIHDIENALESRFPELEWMDDTTREAARTKVKALANKIGYPDHWLDYSKLKLGRTSYFENASAVTRFEFARQLSRVGGPVDKSEWWMNPQAVNAGYSPNANDITFPAGLLQPPFFHRDFPAAMNYGAVGVVMGHEITHGFDDEGRQFDPLGVLRAWWTPQATAAFEKRAQCVADQYSGYEAIPGVHVNGRLTLGENIGDVGGVRESFLAYKAWEKRSGKPGPGLGTLSGDQLFFVAHAQDWCGLVTPEEARRRVTVDVHSPAQARVVGPLVDSPDFARVFQCAEGTPMNPVKRCEIW